MSFGPVVDIVDTPRTSTSNRNGSRNLRAEDTDHLDTSYRVWVFDTLPNSRDTSVPYDSVRLTCGDKSFVMVGWSFSSTYQMYH